MEADLDGKARRFAVSLSLGTEAGQTSAMLSGRMLEEWEQPFGVSWLSLDDVTLELAIGEGEGASAKLGSSFAVGTKTGVVLRDVALLALLELVPRGGAHRNHCKEKVSTFRFAPAVREPVGEPGPAVGHP